jgi:hypothetical protein
MQWRSAFYISHESIFVLLGPCLPRFIQYFNSCFDAIYVTYYNQFSALFYVTKGSAGFYVPSAVAVKGVTF